MMSSLSLIFVGGVIFHMVSLIVSEIQVSPAGTTLSV